MKALYLIFIALLFQSCNRTAPVNTQSTEGLALIDFNDTTFLKTIKWDSLNAFVSYHILQKGTLTNGSDIHFSVTPIAYYYSTDRAFEKVSNPKHDILAEDEPKDTAITLSPSELAIFILSDSFSKLTSFDCLLKINSHINIQRKPTLLQTIFVRIEDTSIIKSLTTDLRKENYAEEVTWKAQVTPHIFKKDSTKNIIIKIKLRPAYRDLKKISKICSELKQRPNIADVFSSSDFYTGLNEMEYYFRLKSKK